jgi:hypothetical protein
LRVAGHPTLSVISTFREFSKRASSPEGFRSLNDVNVAQIRCPLMVSLVCPEASRRIEPLDEPQEF